MALSSYAKSVISDSHSKNDETLYCFEAMIYFICTPLDQRLPVWGRRHCIIDWDLDTNDSTIALIGYNKIAEDHLWYIYDPTILNSLRPSGAYMRR